ncbi:MAG: hypothetical protein H0T89_35675 [Deltaproteobacteria bacterium]|nr:hypothetical protein [Deltaproteobacteria bacterium]MDQ3296581.1 hypothetical protein [Myxococcota bacterium]
MNASAWVLVVLVTAAACGTSDRPPPDKRRRVIPEETLADPQQDPLPDPDLDPPQPPPPDRRGMLGTLGTLGTLGSTGTPSSLPDPNAPKPECVDEGDVVSFDPQKLRACFDSNGDGDPDRCVTWRRDGKVVSIDTIFHVEDSDMAAIEPHVEYRSDEDNNDDERITLDNSSIEVCPYDRTCMRLMPKVGLGDVQHVLTDADYRRGVVVIRDEDGSKGTFELWDLAAGKLRTRLAMRRLASDEYYDFSARLGTGAFIALADNEEGFALGTVFGIDGSFRGELAGGSRTLDLDRTFQHAGVFGIIDGGPVDDEKPYVVYLQSLANGSSLGKFTIKRDDDGDDDLAFNVIKSGFVALTQWGDQVRIDMIDLRTRTNRVLLAPSC